MSAGPGNDFFSRPGNMDCEMFRRGNGPAGKGPGNRGLRSFSSCRHGSPLFTGVHVSQSVLVYTPASVPAIELSRWSW